MMTIHDTESVFFMPTVVLTSSTGHLSIAPFSMISTKAETTKTWRRKKKKTKQKKTFINIFGIYVLHFLGVAKRRHSLHINVKQ